MGAFCATVNCLPQLLSYRRGVRILPMNAYRFRLRSALGAAFLAAALAACAPTVDQRGNLPSEEKLATIRPGITTKDTVSQLLGTPSTVGTFDPNIWYYISNRTEQVSFFKPELLDQQVVAIAFDENGVVRDIQRHGMDDRHDVAPVARATPAPGRELSLMEQFFGNLGKFNSDPSQGIGQARRR